MIFILNMSIIITEDRVIFREKKKKSLFMKNRLNDKSNNFLSPRIRRTQKKVKGEKIMREVVLKKTKFFFCIFLSSSKYQQN